MKETISPQAENGHIDIANEVAEALYTLQISGNQWRILWVILRQTWGWHKKNDCISITFFEKKTRLKRRHIKRALDTLIERNIVTKNGNTSIVSYGFNKHYNEWVLLPKLVSITKNGQKSLPKLVPTKETTKESISCSDSKKNESKRKLSFSKMDVMLTKTLNKLLRENNPKRKPTTEKELKTWANECRLMRERDGRTPKEIYDHIKFSQADPFWKQNILSISKLRKQFDILTLRMNKNNGKQYDNGPEPY